MIGFLVGINQDIVHLTSCTVQIPFCVIIGWPMGTQMDLNFQLFETGTLFITVLVVAFMLQEGTANYFKGLMLVLCYLIVGASFFVHRDSLDPHSGI
jgi:Ca2+:H+ antiporter